MDLVSKSPTSPLPICDKCVYRPTDPRNIHPRCSKKFVYDAILDVDYMSGVKTSLGFRNRELSTKNVILGGDPRKEGGGPPHICR